MRIYQYNYKEDFAEQAGIPEEDIADTGVIAQEVQEVLPDAVRETGDVVLSGGSRIENFMVVNKVRYSTPLNCFIVYLFEFRIEVACMHSLWVCIALFCTVLFSRLFIWGWYLL